MFNKILIGLITVIIFTKCKDTKVKDSLFNQTNEMNIKALIADTVPKDSLIYIPITINNPKFKLYEVVQNCNITDTTTADTSKWNLFPKLTHLIISFDTAKYWINTDNTTGNFTNNDVTIIAQSKDKKFYYQKVQFGYYVK